MLDGKGALGSFLISLPLVLFAFFLAGFLISFALARSESCRVLNDDGSRLGFLLALLFVRATSCLAWSLGVLNNEGACRLDDGGEGRGLFDAPSTPTFLEEVLFIFLMRG